MDKDNHKEEVAATAVLKGRKARAARLTRFSDMTVKQKAFRVSVHILGIVLALVSLALVLQILITGKDEYNRLWSAIGGILLFSAPLIIEPVFKWRPSNFVLAYFYIYTFLAYFIGCVMGGYYHLQTVYFDKIMHVALGYVGCSIGMLVLCRTKSFEKIHPAVVVFFCVGIAMTYGTVWEIAEFSVDSFLGQTAQGVPVATEDGTLFTPINDTMWDMICNFGGSMIFTLHYILHVATKKNLLMGSLIKGCKN